MKFLIKLYCNHSLNPLTGDIKRSLIVWYGPRSLVSYVSLVGRNVMLFYKIIPSSIPVLLLRGEGYVFHESFPRSGSSFAVLIFAFPSSGYIFTEQYI